MVESNLAYRKDNRTDEQFNDNRNRGTKIQVQLLEKFVERHQQFVEEYPECPLKMLDIHHLVNNNLDRGDYRDGLDGKIKMQIRDADPFWQLVEIECVEKPTVLARFKKDKIRRCIRRNAPIIHFQTGGFSPSLFVFSVESAKLIDAKNAYQPEAVYGGKDAYTFNTAFPDPPIPYVAWPSLDPLEDYKEVLKALRK